MKEGFPIWIMLFGICFSFLIYHELVLFHFQYPY